MLVNLRLMQPTRPDTLVTFDEEHEGNVLNISSLNRDVNAFQSVHVSKLFVWIFYGLDSTIISLLKKEQDFT